MKKTISVIGGDSRQLYAAGYLNKNGYNVSIYACEHGKLPEGTLFINDISDAMKSDIIILPLPVSKNGALLNTPLSSKEIKLKDITDSITENHTVFFGMGNSAFTKQLSAKTSLYTDYFNFESLIYKNALLTSEGILQIMLEKIPVTIFGMKVAITGFGRIGYFITDKLIKLGADVSVFARNEIQRLKAETIGAHPYKIESLLSEISSYDCVINTVPSMVIDNNSIKKSKRDCVFIETASAPYGINAEACTENYRTLIKAFSLPGKTAPASAGIIIGETIHSALKEMTE